MSDEKPDAPSAETPSADAPPPAPPPPPELVPAHEAFARGDFRTARAAATALLATKPTSDLDAAARALIARMAPDPWVLRIGVAAIALIVLVTAAYLF